MTIALPVMRGRAERPARAERATTSPPRGFDFYSHGAARAHRARGGRAAPSSSSTPSQPPAGEMPVVLAAGSSGILLHEAIGHGMEADFNRKDTSIYADRIGKPIAKPVRQHRRRRHHRVRARRHQRRRRGQRREQDDARRERRARHLPARLASRAKHYGVKPTGQRPPRELPHAPLPRMRSTYMLPGPHKQRRDHRVGEEGHLLLQLHQRPGARSARATSPST